MQIVPSQILSCFKISRIRLLALHLQCITSSSDMAERPRELDQRFQMGVNLRLL